MKSKIFILGTIALALAGCAAAPVQTIQPLSGTARAEFGQAEAQNAGSSGTVQGVTPQLPPKGPDGGPL